MVTVLPVPAFLSEKAPLKPLPSESVSPGTMPLKTAPAVFSVASFVPS